MLSAQSLLRNFKLPMVFHAAFAPRCEATAEPKAATKRVEEREQGVGKVTPFESFSLFDLSSKNLPPGC